MRTAGFDQAEHVPFTSGARGGESDESSPLSTYSFTPTIPHSNNFIRTSGIEAFILWCCKILFHTKRDIVFNKNS